MKEAIMNEAIFGILGTVVGTVLGWALNCITNSTGKIDIACEHQYCTFHNSHMSKNVFFYERPDSVNVVLRIRITNFKGRTVGLNSCRLEMQYQDHTEYFVDISLEDDVGDNLDELTNIPSHYTKSIFFVHNIPFLPDSEKLKNGYKIIMRYHINGKKKEHKAVLVEQKNI